MIPALIAFGLGMGALQSDAPPPPPDVGIAIIGYGDERETGRIIAALAADGRLRPRRATVSVEDLRRCMGDDPEPTEERRSCIRAAMAGPRDAPIVVVALADTMERGSWQRMECIGPGNTGFRRTTYVRDFDHPRPDVSQSVLSDLAGCIGEALEKPW